MGRCCRSRKYLARAPQIPQPLPLAARLARLLWDSGSSNRLLRTSHCRAQYTRKVRVHLRRVWLRSTVRYRILFFLRLVENCDAQRRKSHTCCHEPCLVARATSRPTFVPLHPHPPRAKRESIVFFALKKSIFFAGGGADRPLSLPETSEEVARRRRRRRRNHANMPTALEREEQYSKNRIFFDQGQDSRGSTDRCNSTFWV